MVYLSLGGTKNFALEGHFVKYKKKLAGHCINYNFFFFFVVGAGCLDTVYSTNSFGKDNVKNAYNLP